MMRNIKNILKRLSWWFVSALWLAMVITLITGAHNSPRGGLRVPEELLAGVHLADESTWMGIYINSHKIGYIHTELEPLKPHGYEIREFSSLQGAMMGVMQQMRMRMTVITDSTLALISFEGRLETDLYLTVFKGLIEDRVLKIEVTTGGRKSDKFIPAPEPIYISQAIKPLLHAGRLDESDSLKLAGFDPVRLEMQDLVVIGAKLEPQRLWGEDVMVRKLTTRLAGFESTLYVDNEGNTLVEYGPLGMMMRREEMDVALTVEDDRSSVDFLAIYSIKPEGSIRAPRKNQLGVYCVYGFDITKAAKSSDVSR